MGDTSLLIGRGIKSTMNNIVDGKLYFTTDTNELFFGNGTQRIKISDIQIVDELPLIGIANMFYCVNNVLYRFENGKWIRVGSDSTNFYTREEVDELIKTASEKANKRVNGLEKILYEPLVTDLGLPSKNLWFNRNISAVQPDWYGNYFSFGELNSKLNYPLSTDGTLEKLKSDGVLNVNGELTHDYDIASDIFSVNVHVPTKADFEELIEYTEVETLNWQYYCKLVSKVNGNSIEIPFGGVKKDSTVDFGRTNLNQGHYWTATHTGNSVNAYEFGTRYVSGGRLGGTVGVYIAERNVGLGLAIRPVLKIHNKNF